jgi:hypothetical protein
VGQWNPPKEIGPMIREIKHLPAKTGPKEIDPAQGRLDLHVDKQTENSRH